MRTGGTEENTGGMVNERMRTAWRIYTLRYVPLLFMRMSRGRSKFIIFHVRVHTHDQSAQNIAYARVSIELYEVGEVEQIGIADKR